MRTWCDIFARDPVEAWEVDFARAVHQVIADSLKDVVYLVLAVVSMCWNQAFNVCQWVNEHIAERLSVISAANRFTDFVAMPALGRRRVSIRWRFLCIQTLVFQGFVSPVSVFYPFATRRAKQKSQ